MTTTYTPALAPHRDARARRGADVRPSIPGTLLTVACCLMGIGLASGIAGTIMGSNLPVIAGGLVTVAGSLVLSTSAFLGH